MNCRILSFHTWLESLNLQPRLNCTQNIPEKHHSFNSCNLKKTKQKNPTFFLLILLGQTRVSSKTSLQTTSASFPPDACAALQSGATHPEVSAIYRLPHTWTHRCSRLTSVAGIDTAKTVVIPPILRAWKLLLYCQDLNHHKLQTTVWTLFCCATLEPQFMQF